MKSYIAVTLLVVFCICQIHAYPADLSMRLERLSMLPENQMRKNDLTDPAHESLYTAERYRYNEKLKALSATEQQQQQLNEQEDASTTTSSLLSDEIAKNPKVEKNVRTLVSSMLGLMSGLLRSHLRDEQPAAANN